MRISMSAKNFILILLAFMFLMFCMGLSFVVLFENIFISMKTSEYTRLAQRFSLDYEGDVQKSIELIDEMEEKYGLAVVIADQIGIIRYTTVIKGNPWGGMASRWKNDNISIPLNVRQKLLAGEVSVYYTRNEKFGLRVMNIAAPLMNNEVLVLETSLIQAKDVINFTGGFFIFATAGALLIGLALSYLISQKTMIPVNRLKYIAGSIAEADYSVRYTDNKSDETGDIGRSLNIIARRMEEYSVKIKALESKVNECANREKVGEQRRSEFLVNVSQELINPVSVIGSYARRLRCESSDNEQEREYRYKVIEEEAEKMTALIAELLEITKLEKKNGSHGMVTFELVSMVGNIYKRYEQEILERGIKFVLLPSDKSITVKGDPYRIEQVIIHLMTNAIKYAEGEKGIAVKLQKTAGRTVLRIFNTGRSIPEDELDKIWDSFYRVNRDEAPSGISTGLGLYIVRKILSIHKSRFGVRNLSGGVEFWFDLENF